MSATTLQSITTNPDDGSSAPPKVSISEGFEPKTITSDTTFQSAPPNPDGGSLPSQLNSGGLDPKPKTSDTTFQSFPTNPDGGSSSTASSIGGLEPKPKTSATTFQSIPPNSGGGSLPNELNSGGLDPQPKTSNTTFQSLPTNPDGESSSKASSSGGLEPRAKTSTTTFQSIPPNSGGGSLPNELNSGGLDPKPMTNDTTLQSLFDGEASFKTSSGRLESIPKMSVTTFQSIPTNSSAEASNSEGSRSKPKMSARALQSMSLNPGDLSSPQPSNSAPLEPKPMMSTATFQSTSSSAESTPRSLNSGGLGPKPKREISPFNLIWSFGVNTTVDMINLTTKSESRVFYACSNVPVVYSLSSDTQHLLQGHRNSVTSIASDSSGRWLASADKGKCSSIIIWDSLTFHPLHVIFDPHLQFGTALLAMSGNAKYLVSIGNEPKAQIKLWLWSYGDSDPSDVFTLTYSCGAPCRICFNPNVQEHIWVAFQRQVIFLEWNVEENKLNPPVLPKVRNSKTHGLITDCTYFEKCHQCVASTAHGVLLVFGSTYYRRTYGEHTLQNNKMYVKAIKISKTCITCVTSVDGLLVTGDVNGHLKFYDDAVRILFWCQNFALPAITSISFDLEKRNYKIQDPLDFTDDFDVDIDKSDQIELLYASLVPSDATVQALPFVVRNFLIATDDGRVASVNFLKNKCYFLNRIFSSPVTAIDVHDEL